MVHDGKCGKGEVTVLRLQRPVFFYYRLQAGYEFNDDVLGFWFAVPIRISIEILNIKLIQRNKIISLGKTKSAVRRLHKERHRNAVAFVDVGVGRRVILKWRCEDLKRIEVAGDKVQLQVCGFYKLQSFCQRVCSLLKEMHLT